MRACIRRGAHQIGGTCIELESQGQRIVLDVGLPLDADPDPSLVPNVEGLVSADATLLAVFVSHAHQDHYGLLPVAPNRPRVFMGPAAARMLEAASLFWGGAGRLGETEPLSDRVPVEIGPFRVTPYLVDHSAYDAYAFLVEADGQRLFYSGDLRAHGRKAGLFEKLLRRGPEAVDVLLLEGTTLGRPGDETYASEVDLEHRMVEEFQAAPGLVLVQTSGINIDRLVTIYRAAVQARRTLILDMYAAGVLRATGNPNVPQAEWDDVRVFLPHTQKLAVLNAEAFEFSGSFSKRRIYPEALAAAARHAVMLFRPSMIPDLEAADCLGSARLIYSLWTGYLQRAESRRLLDWLEQREIPLVACHTSGHAAPADLKRLVAALQPRVVVPVHSEVPERYAELWQNANAHSDGEWFEVVARPSDRRCKAS